MSAAKKKKNLDFLMISGRIKSKEVHLVSTQTVDKLIDAPDMAEVLKILSEHGYDISGLTGEEKNLASILCERDRAETAEIATQAGNGLFDCFLYPNDYHNLKVALKNELLSDPRDIFTSGGSVSVEELRDGVKNRDYRSLTDMMGNGVEEALDVYNRTGNSQMIDIVLDRYCFKDMAKAAEKVDNEFLSGYVRTLVDVANVKALLRLRKMGKSPEFASQVFFEGGNATPERFTAAYNASNEELPSLLGGAASLMQKALAEMSGGNGMSGFELFCDNYLMDYIRNAKYVPYGAEVPMAYLLAKETEYKVISMILAGRQTGLPANSIKERLRALYV
ncbi:MAG: V-type ATPase subunit [Clostridia bacterium]|nr:V-type ATPase subunit [Clostridia bacterium]